MECFPEKKVFKPSPFTTVTAVSASGLRILYVHYLLIMQADG